MSTDKITEKHFWQMVVIVGVMAWLFTCIAAFFIMAGGILFHHGKSDIAQKGQAQKIVGPNK